MIIVEFEQVTYVTEVNLARKFSYDIISNES